jgi:hypothetical protein
MTQFERHRTQQQRMIQRATSSDVTADDQVRVTRWRLFKPKITIWVNLGCSCNGRWWYILWLFGVFYGHSVHLVAIRRILRTFGTFCGHLVYFRATFGIFLQFWFVITTKIWQPISKHIQRPWSMPNFPLPSKIHKILVCKNMYHLATLK